MTRTFPINPRAPHRAHTHHQHRFASNYIHTTKYHPLTFLPLFLLEQFSKTSNALFLCTSCLQQIEGLAPTNKYATSIGLLFVLSVSAVKEAWEDWRRRVADIRANRSTAHLLIAPEILDGGNCKSKDLDVKDMSKAIPAAITLSTRSIDWAQVIVGDILLVHREEEAPADLIILRTSESGGLCYVETANIDGETNLKIRSAPNALVGMAIEEIIRLKGSVTCEQPNSRIYGFEGRFDLESCASATMQHGVEQCTSNPNHNPNQHCSTVSVPLSNENMIIRGSRLRNTDWIIGCVAYTGHETKIMKNTISRQLKITRMESIYNQQTVFLFLVILAIMIGSCAVNRWYEQDYFSRHPYIVSTINWRRKRDALYRFLMFCLLYHNFVPINLNITVEMVRLFLGMAIGADEAMHDPHQEEEEKEERVTVCKTSTLVEELGQVRFVFTDKTGTLTCNQMVLKHIVAGNTLIRECLAESKVIECNGIVTDPGTASTQANDDKVEFMRMLALCHTVVIDRHQSLPSANHTPSLLTYQASSPDEAAMVSAAARLGWIFTARDQHSLYIDTPFGHEEWEVRGLIEFSSQRRRMSIILRRKGRTVLYCKGADSVILERIATQDNVKEVREALGGFGREGLRTLCFAYRELDEPFIESWLRRWNEAQLMLNDGQKTILIEQLQNEMEAGWRVVGATAVEDRLQDDVPQTIGMLREAGMCVWVLTGDRQETALNIGYSCGLLNSNTCVGIIDYVQHNDIIHGDSHDIIGTSNTHANVLSACHIRPDKVVEALFHRLQHIFKPINDKEVALVIDGPTLDVVLKDAVLRPMFVQNACRSTAVICCRSSPEQKAAVVSAVRQYDTGVTLAIGDGANDISMIQAAHIGVGVSGREGQQAVRSADFAITQFRFLQRLLLVHGNYSYHRLSKVFLYCLYKNILLYAGQFWFTFYHGFSGQSLYDGWMLSLYNITFAAGPIIILGVTEQYVQPEKLLKYPALYRLGPQNRFFNRHSYWGQFLNGMLQSLVSILLVTRLAHRGTGGEADLVMLGSTVFAVSVVMVALKVFIIANYWTWPLIWLSALCVSSWFGYCWLVDRLSLAWQRPLWAGGISSILFPSPLFWACLVLVPVVCLARDFLWKFYKRSYAPLSYHIIQEVEEMERKHQQRLQAAEARKSADRMMTTAAGAGAGGGEGTFSGYAFSQSEGQSLILSQLPEFLINPFRL